MRARGLILWLLSLSACGSDARKHNDCAGKPDFIVHIQAKDGFLPTGTRVEVAYGGGSKEPYEIGKTNSPQVMFCDPKAVLPEPSGGGGAAGDKDPSDGGAGNGGHGILGLVCELWTSGPASLSVQAPGFQDTERSLELQPEECPVEDTVELSRMRSPT